MVTIFKRTAGTLFQFKDIHKRKLLFCCKDNNSSSRNYEIGFVGLGNMGSRMALNLLKKGEEVVIYDAVPATLEPFSRINNVKVASNLKEVTSNSKYIFTMLPDDKVVSSAYNNQDGIMRNCKKGSIFIDCSTIDPSVAQELAITAQTKGCVFIDAPVSGGVVGAEKGSLVFMAGGDEEICKTVEQLLLKMGSRVVYCGGSGTGQATKLCNNMLLGITMLGVAEALNLGVRFGLDPKLLLSVINTSSGRCWSSDTNPPIPDVVENAPSSRNYKDGFKMSLLVKDMLLAQKLAAHTESDTFLSSEAISLYQCAISEGLSDYDFSAIYTYIRDRR